MLLKKKFIVILSLMIISCLGIKSNSIDLKGNQYVIISDKENVDRYFNDSIKQFDISNDQLDIIEVVLKDIIEYKRLQPFENYKFQYVCMELDEKIVFVQAICKDSDFLESMDEKGNLFWKKELSIIADGGNCYWTVKVNLDDKNYADLIINTNN